MRGPTGLTKAAHIALAGGIVAVTTWDVNRHVAANTVPVSPEQEAEIHAWKRALASRLEEASSASSMRFMQTLASRGGGGTRRTGARTLGATRGRQRGAWSGGIESDRVGSISRLSDANDDALEDKHDRSPSKNNSVCLQNCIFRFFSRFSRRPASVARNSWRRSRWRPAKGPNAVESRETRDLERVRVGFRAVFKPPLWRAGRKEPRAAPLPRRSTCRRRSLDGRL